MPMSNWLHKSIREELHTIWKREYLFRLSEAWRNLAWPGRVIVFPILVVGATVLAVFTTGCFLVFKTLFR